MSARPTAEISETERRYEDGSDPDVLDVISIQMAIAVPHLHQQENHQIDETQYWKKTGTATWDQIKAAAEDPAGPLWINGLSSTNGLNDRVAEATLSGLKRSLYLIHPENPAVCVALEGGEYEPARRRVRLRFSLCGSDYKIGVTDPVAERKFLAGQNGETKLDEAIVCVSLGEVFHGHAYKLAAAIITPRRAGSNA